VITQMPGCLRHDEPVNDAPQTEPVEAVAAPAAGVTELFHRVNKLLPEAQELLTVSPDTSAGDALELMLAHNYSQLPVVSGNQVLGTFTFRSFARGALDVRTERTDPLDLPVDEFVEQATTVHVTSELNSVFDALDADGAVLVGLPERLDGIVTAVDALRYLYDLAEQFVQLQEIEQGLRAVIMRAVDEDGLQQCIVQSLGKLYEGREDKMPKTVTDMTFAEYVSVIGDRQNWERFEPLLGSERQRVRTRLQRVGDLRNDVFHFRRELTAEDRRELVASRNWVLRKVQLMEQQPEGADA
jgi:CBS domain-containing protein